MTVLNIPRHTTPIPRNATHVVARYTWFVGSVTLALTLAFAILGPVSDTAAAFVMLAAVAFVGLPHGAYDLEVARRLFAPRFGRWWWLGFSVVYVALALLGLALWAAAPIVGLAILLLGGAAHWGLDDLEDAPRRHALTAWLALSRGAIPVAAPMAFHADAVTPIFVGLLGSAVSANAVQSFGLMWLVAAAPGVAASFWSKTPRPVSTTLRIVAEPVVLLLFFASTPPILAFTMYFCFWHAVRHSLRSALEADRTADLRSALLGYTRAAAPPTVLTWLFAAAAAALFLDNIASLEGAWNITFIGLFALAIPHVALEFVENRASHR